MDFPYLLWLLLLELLLLVVLFELWPWLRLWLQKSGNRLLEEVRAAVNCAIEATEEKDEEDEGLVAARDSRLTSCNFTADKPVVVWPMFGFDLALFIVLNSFVLPVSKEEVEAEADVDVYAGYCTFLAPVAVTIEGFCGDFLCPPPLPLPRIELQDVDVDLGSWLLATLTLADRVLPFNGGGSKVLREVLSRILAGRFGGEEQVSAALPLAFIIDGFVYEAYLQKLRYSVWNFTDLSK